jgi:hypothetical protein
VSGRKLNAAKKLKHGFGDYVQVHADTIDNSTKPRTQGAIALMSAGNLCGLGTGGGWTDGPVKKCNAGKR